MKQRCCLLLYIIPVCLFLASCDPGEQVPAYLSIKSIGLKPSGSILQGALTHYIKDAWVYVDNNLIGIFELPARFPVLAEGNHVVRIGAGVFENGISATRIRYPLYDFYEITAEFKAGETVNLTDAPLVNYYSGLKYDWYEDFDGNAIYLARTSTNTAIYDSTSTVDSLPGYNKHARITLDTDHSLMDLEYVGLPEVDISTNGQTFLELNYKSEQPFDVGINVVAADGTEKRSYAATVNRSDNWNKIYIQMSTIVNSNKTAKNFKVYLSTALEAGRTQSVINLDNIKLIHN